jgi:hypothetical protein
MLLDKFNGFTKENMDFYLNELGKELKREFGKGVNIELILVGGASIIMNYNFRGLSMDIDALVSNAGSIKTAINKIGDKHKLPNGWLNQDFKNTSSFSPKIIQYSKYTKTYAGVLTVRSITGEYLVAMKLASYRAYKNDQSDIIGILQQSQDITFEKVEEAVHELYGGWEKMQANSKTNIQECIRLAQQTNGYIQTKNIEKTNKDILQSFENNYPDTLTESNLENILKISKEKEILVSEKERSVSKLKEQER